MSLSTILNLAKTGRVVFADAEYINGALGLGHRPAAGHFKEVTQIGAVRYVGEKRLLPLIVWFARASKENCLAMMHGMNILRSLAYPKKLS